MMTGWYSATPEALFLIDSPGGSYYGILHDCLNKYDLIILLFYYEGFNS